MMDLGGFRVQNARSDPLARRTFFKTPRQEVAGRSAHALREAGHVPETLLAGGFVLEDLRTRERAAMGENVADEPPWN